ncbi:hypothetical protein BG015_003774 [Linnemannia schmuckeri]|uniref:Uncharacterized protein n=1 Tax=Linnemannia schmuckeri TaxID=64567 RepID=A0A9P5S5S1_9FUNG|nr:hypothetical protein BG015_003774 [Linnemannia schmuckeri]
MAAYIRTLARIATRVSTPSTVTFARQAPAAMVARHYHAFRPTEIAYKKKHAAIMDEDDEELEAELRELEREKREQEALERGETLDGSAADGAEDIDNKRFQEQYDILLEKTAPSSPQHELPRHTALLHLANAISTPEQAQSIPQLVQQWRRRELPISVLLSDKLIKAVCKAGSPETALVLLGDREVYALAPGQGTMRRVVRSFVKEVAAAPESSESEEGLEKLDGAFKTMALIPYYNLAADDSSVYANLVRGSLIYGGEEGLRRASVTMDEYLLIDGERETPLTRRRAAEVVAAAEQLVKAYEAKGDADKAQELNKHVAQWKKSI